MKVEIFTLCDAATEYGGKLNILGSFDHLWAKEVPVVHPHCAVAIKLRFARIEEGNHRLRITVGDADGKLVLPALDASVAVRFTADGDETAVANLILNIQQLKLPSFGEYTVDMAVDGRQEGSLPLYLRAIKTPAPESPG